MDPIIDSDWLGCKNEPIDEAPVVGNIARSWQWRERGLDPPHCPPNKTVLENIAEDILVQKPLKIRCCDLPGYPRSTFLMVFSPDGTKVASTHGNHNVYVSELASGKHVRILKGHPRTPWCIAFHPSHPQLIGSGCLGGQVRVWDISTGGSEVWNVRNETVIASIAFHPREQLLVIATYNELYFWDWSQPTPFTKVSTNNVNEKVRYVAFDSLGYKLITGISLWASPAGSGGSSLLQQNPIGPMNNPNITRRDDPGDSQGSNNRPSENSGSAQDMIVNSYHNLVQRYDSLVRNYQRLFMVRHRLTNTPPPPSTIDRGTDPMETDLSPGPSWRRSPRLSSSNSQFDDDAASRPSTSRRQDSADSGDGESSSSRLLNLDVLSFDTNHTRNEDLSQDSQREHSIFGSRSSAFQPLNDQSGRSPRTQNRNERTRLLPNPFSSTSSTTRSYRNPTLNNAHQSSSSSTTSTSRTNIFTSSRSESSGRRDFLQRRRNSLLLQQSSNDSQNENLSISTDNDSRRLLNFGPRFSSSSGSDPATAATNTSPRPTMTNTATQMSPVSSSVDAQSINESLDLIRDILRDSGTRLLNLITNMSLSTLATVVRDMPQQRSGSRTQSDDSETGGQRPIRPRIRLFSSSLRRDLLSSSSDSDSDQSLEVNIFRTRNSTFRDNDRRNSTQPTESGRPTDRMIIDLGEDVRNDVSSFDPERINVSLSNSRFRVRTQSDSMNESSFQETERSNENRRQSTSDFNPDRPSTSRDNFNPDRPSTSRENFWMQSGAIPSEEAYRKVKAGVNALQKHTMLLTQMWLRGNRTTMRELRNMWENLRRRIIMLHRETGRQDVPSYYTRSLLERCMMLTDMTDNSRTSGIPRTPRSTQRNGDSERNDEESRNIPTSSGNVNTFTSMENEPSLPTETTSDSRQRRSSRSPQTKSTSNVRTSPIVRRRLQSSYRWRPEDELRRRSRNPTSNRLFPSYYTRSRRDFARAIEINATRHAIRMRAMQVLSVMFNMMMMCLEERGLSQLIIHMLRTLKKALALTCLMLMTNRNNARSGTNTVPPSSRVDSLNVVRIQNVDHAGPVNVDEPEEASSPVNSTFNGIEDNRSQNNTNDKNKTHEIEIEKSPNTQRTPKANITEESSPSTSNNIISHKWSNRLAVQIAAANRNTSATARNRREMYIETKRQKALHRTNPTAHPLIKKRVLPPVSNHRIPMLRNLPRRVNLAPSTPRIGAGDEPIAGPSTAGLSVTDNSNRDSTRSEVFSEFEHRLNLIRMAHMQAVRLRNAARNRFRRLQTIRLYTPSSVREMFALQSNNTDNPQENRPSLQNAQELGNRRSFTAYRPHILTPVTESTNRSHDEPNQFHTVLNNVAMPLMQVNDLPVLNEGPSNSTQRLPRIHEYLQPIILAQNAMVVDDEGNGENGNGGGGGGGGGGGSGGAGVGGGLGPRRMNSVAGLLDAGIISEAFPAPSHRVQAWDFTTGHTPDIADSTKNVVVQRCRIHNDASIDISKDGRLLVALLPVQRLRNTNHWLGVYSLEWARLGQCLHTAVLEQSAVSVALSPTARYLAVGLGSRRFTTLPHARNNVFALLYKLDPLETSSRTGLAPIKELEQNWEQGFTSLNCLRWAPQPGQGLVYANNTGQLIIMS